MLKSVLSQKDIANLFSVPPASPAPPLLIPLSIAPARAIPFEVLSLSLLEYPSRYSLLFLLVFFFNRRRRKRRRRRTQSNDPTSFTKANRFIAPSFILAALLQHHPHVRALTPCG